METNSFINSSLNFAEKDFCIIDNSIKSLTEIEKMGFQGFFDEFHKRPLKKIYKYYPNKKVWDKEQKKYRNYSIEALENDTIYMQDATNFDDCFDCAFDLDYNKFLETRVLKYCEYFNIEKNDTDNIQDLVYKLSIKFYQEETIENILSSCQETTDSAQKLTIEIFVRKVKIDVDQNKSEWGPAIFKVINLEYKKLCNTFKSFRISCFSTSPLLNRMWSSSYGNDNKGFCIEYDLEINDKYLKDLYEQIYPVIYSQSRNDLLPLCTNCDKMPSVGDLWQMYFNGMLRKSLYWFDQQEWRLILHKNSFTENPIKFFKISKVFLGNKMNKYQRKKIIKICEREVINYVGLVRDLNSFNLIECKKNCKECNNTHK